MVKSSPPVRKGISLPKKRNCKNQEEILIASADLPLRAEIFSVDQMCAHGQNMAASHRFGPATQCSLLERLNENAIRLLGVNQALTEDAESDSQITPAGEWLLDNYYLIEEQISSIMRFFPKSYSRELPTLLDGPQAGYPRVYDIALETVSHSDGRIDLDSLKSFIRAYQAVSNLKLGELWAIPIMLQLALIENLRRVADRISNDRIHRKNAKKWVDMMAEAVELDPKSQILVIADMARSLPPMSSAFVAELSLRLNALVPVLSLPLVWVEQSLAEAGQSIEKLVRTENQQLAANQITVSNSIDSLRILSALDWREFVEHQSKVEDILHRDPADLYAQMDFGTRDAYRHVVEKVARRSQLTEPEVAELAIQLAQKSAEDQSAQERQTHVGYYLIDQGLPELESLAKMRRSPVQKLRKIGRNFALPLYLGSIALLTLIFTALLMLCTPIQGLHLGLKAALGLLLLLGGSQLSMALVNWLATLLRSPHILPRMDFSKGLPEEVRSLVVVPTMLSQPQDIEELVKALEVRFLANQDDYLHFGLLTDFLDGDKADMPADQELLQLAAEGIKELNIKYSSPEQDIFFLFHRPRRWNPSEKAWMGFERKRGKLAELNKLLRGVGEAYFSLIVGRIDILQGVKYIITLDTDTQLIRDSAREMIGTMAHPLNLPVYDAEKRLIKAGYGILQPRVSISVPGASKSLFAQMSVSESGIDPYTRSVSDVYQDLFGEGSFIGKGIYDLDAFELTLNDRFPDNRILSHDLLEGCFARSGLLSDVQLYEEYPSRYDSHVKRRHRWMRGDWQIAQWALPWVPEYDGRLHRNQLSLLSRWKIFDNLRRSLVSLSLTILLLLGWTVLPVPLIWTLAVLGILILPALVAASVSIFRVPQDQSLKEHLNVELRAMRRKVSEIVFELATLPYEAYYSLTAVLITIKRVLFTHRKLLEWNPFSASNQGSNNSLISSYRTMAIAPLTALLTLAALILFHADRLIFAVPMLTLWLCSPAIAWWISKPFTRREAQLSEHQILFLKKLSRKTWAFFETFVTAEENWLPPDNHQELPVAVTAHRTSPTNMGLALLANLSAYDFGFICMDKLLERSRNTLQSMQKLKRYRGHFYNWYDTRSLQALTPLYVSSVDSGNLAGYLLVLKSGLLGIVESSFEIKAYLSGLESSFEVVAELSAAVPDTVLTRIVQKAEAQLAAALKSEPATLSEFRQFLIQFAQSILALEDTAVKLDQSGQNPLTWWAESLGKQCRNILNELIFLAPWIDHLASEDNPGTFLELDQIYSLQELAELPARFGARIQSELAAAKNKQQKTWLNRLLIHLQKASHNVEYRISFIHELASQCEELSNMDYDFLYNEQRHLLSVGYQVNAHKRDASFYDLLASEARFSSFVGIAQGKLPQETWFFLGRLLTSSGGAPILLSWSGSMFEYLMPLLVMPDYGNTLLNQTYQSVVTRQIEYGKKRSVPWGISESGYNAIDVHQNYQYRAFGVPGLGLKRGLAADLVIAPYASALALMVAPEEACRNLELLAKEGFEGRYGMYEAIDYTATRLPRGQTHALVSSFMAHHQGMVLLSLAYVLSDQPMQKRFESDPRFQATLLLLQERIPTASIYHARTANLTDHFPTASPQEAPFRVYTDPNTAYPEVQILSNGRYHIMLTNAGGGYSRWKELALTRWREDRTCDNWGTFCYIRDLASQDYWSVSPQPTGKEVDFFEAVFSEGRVEYRSSKHNIDTHTEIAVSPEDDIEVRCVSITNRSRYRRTVELTSYAEVVVAPPAADAMHPAFSNLFVQTEIIKSSHAILCHRRPRSEAEQEPWLLHLIAVHESKIKELSYETSRLKFIGRGNTIINPQALSQKVEGGYSHLSNTSGSVLDPIFAIRCQIELDPDETVKLNMITGIGETKADALNLIEKYQDRHLVERVFNLAWTHGRILLRQFNITEHDAQLYNRLASSIIYANASLRADSTVLNKNYRGQSGLWGYAISGDYPIVLLQIEDPDRIDLVRQLIQAHAYWRFKGLIVDLVIWNEDHAGYRQLLHDQITGIIEASGKTVHADQAGRVFLRTGEQISEEDRILIKSVARVIIKDSRGSLAEQIQGRRITELNVPLLKPTRSLRAESSPVTPLPRTDLMFFNGIGGFTPDGKEYVITTTRQQVTPAPWVNVLANAQFGTVVSENGLAFSWGENSHEFRLTPWMNDPVSDTRGEAFYLRDEERGNFWSPTPEPCKGTTPYVSRHGFGYSVFEHKQHGIETELWVYVALNDSVKFTVLKVRNSSERKRKLSATGYVEWVLGAQAQKSAMHVITEEDPLSGALLARNQYNTDFPERVAFFDLDAPNRSSTCDRTEFLGRNGSLSSPAAMLRSKLSGRSGTALDPCAALQVSFELAPGQQQEYVFRLGLGRDLEDAKALIKRFRGQMAAKEALDAVWHYWGHTLGAVNVETPDRVLNMLANGWLLYQVISCRLWARSATYQSGGAFGFRDQLQDMLALIHAQPKLVREHLLLCAAHQFPEGDVQHWWHPPMGNGVRTRCSDDYLWLPFVLCHYVQSTGDTGILEEQTSFVLGRLVNAHEDSYYDVPGRSQETASLYEHSVLAILNGLEMGVHGLPLMGTGDWNDGMNMVGEHGAGESVWLGFLLFDVLNRFAELANNYGDVRFAKRCLQEAATLRQNLHTAGWDGEWYRRAYFDDGTPLGSSENTECRIDSISQSWSVLSGAGDANYSQMAMAAVDKYLVRRDSGMVLLFDPPFDKSPLNPGYIKGYVPGVRENGGQYTHAAVWAAMAFAKLGDSKRAWELFALLNPINHARSAQDCSVYMVEPYVMAADVYAASSHTGRGGWTWYTGSAALMYVFILESLLGLKLEVDRLTIKPCLPPEWQGFKLHYRYRETVYHIELQRSSNAGAAMSVSVDGAEQKDGSIHLVDDQREHWVKIELFA